jgi:heptosyltransferase-2
VADGLVERFDASIVILTAPADWDVYRQIESKMSVRPVHIDEKLMSLPLLKALVSRLNLLLCTDSGARHVAVAFGVPTVVIMGPTDPRYTATDCEKGVIVREEVDCGPCQKKVCPTDHRCMTRITSEKVLEEASVLLEERAGR